MEHDVFISYSSVNKETAIAICHVLEDNKIRCWIAPRNIPAGADYGDVIDTAITACKVFLLVYSEPAAISPWVNGELNLAFTGGKYIVPYRIDKTPLKGAMKLILSQRHWIDKHPDANNEFKDLAESILPIFSSDNDSKTASTKADESNHFTLKIKTDAACTIYVDDEKAADAKTNKITRVELQKGKYLLKFESKLRPEITKEIVYNVDGIGSDDLLLVEINSQVMSAIPDNQLEPYICEGGCGFNYKGKKALSLKYNCAWNFIDGLARVKLNGKFGFIDKTGKEVAAPKYDGLGIVFNDGLTSFEVNNKEGYIDKNGKEIIAPKYDMAFLFSDGLAGVKLNDKWGFIDTAGKEVIPIKHEDVSPFSEGVAPVKLNNKWGLIDKNGKEVIAPKYNFVNTFEEGLLPVELNWKYGFIDKRGNEAIPLKYDYVYDFFEGLSAVEIDGKWGFINKLGYEVIPLKYDSAEPFNEGLAAVELNDKCGFIGKNGKEVIPLKYNATKLFCEGLAGVMLDELYELYGFIDRMGKVVIPPRYDEVYSFQEGFVQVGLADKWGFIDKRGNEVTPLKYDEVKSFRKGLAQIKLNGKSGYVDKQGNEYWE